MERMQNFIANWNANFPNYVLNVADLKSPQAVIGAVFQIFDRLGYDKEAVLAPPPEEERNESTAYYWDLLPVINVTRMINHLVAVIPQSEAKISISHFLQPTPGTSLSILLLLFNLMVFNEERLADIAPCEEELFAKADQVKALEDRKNKLLEMLNEQAQEKSKRAGRLEKLQQDTKRYEEELNREKQLHDDDKQELEAIIKERRQTEVILEQKKTQRDALKAEVAKKQALRVYDADEIKAKAKQAAQNVQEAEENLNLLQSTLMQKENSLKNLQTIKPSLDIAVNLTTDIIKLADSLRECESGDLDSDSLEGELQVLALQRGELGAALAELRAERARRCRQREAAAADHAARRAERELTLKEAEEKDKKCRERCKEATQRIDDIKQQTINYEDEKVAGLNEINNIKDTFAKELATVEDALLKKAVEVEKKIDEKLKKQNK